MCSIHIQGQERDEQINEGTTQIFEGNLVYHKATKLCEDQYRVVLSMQFSTDPRMNPFQQIMMWLKDRAFVGSGY
jgi:hypothetical protein